MKRTFARPLPSGKLKVPEAVIAGTAFGAMGVGMLYSFTNPVVAALGAGNILLYSGVCSNCCFSIIYFLFYAINFLKL
jgi:heme O synthase-like polyprenyltransferase